MLKKSLFCFFVFLLFSQQIFAAAKFPFPQDQDYSSHNAIKPAGADHNAVQAAYTVWLNNFYEESGTMARVKWDIPAQTVSEGIGYGMLIMVYMDNATNNTQAKFDKLWAYYNTYKDANGLMNWKLNGFTGVVVGSGGATDGDLDVALALCLAYYQWGTASYKTDATTLLGKIWASEVSGNMLKPGDQFSSPQNPSYFITAGLDMFSKIQFDNNAWGTVATNCYALLAKAANATTGLVPDWCDGSTGSPDAGRGPTYTFDAARTPWRMGMAYCWYGDASAKTIAGKMNTWIQSSTGNDPSKILSGYNLNGTSLGTLAGSYNLPTYIGPFACAAMVDNASQTWLNACYTRLCTFIDNDNYYNQCLKVLSLLLLTGNCLDFSTATPKTAFKITTSVSPANAGSVTASPSKSTYAAGDQVTFTAAATGTTYKFLNWGGDLSGTTTTQNVTIAHDMSVIAYFNAGASDLIEDCEDGDSLNKMGGSWFTYNDAANGGTSIVTPKTTPTSPFVMTAGGANGSSKAATISYTLHKGTNLYNPFAGFGFWIKKYTPPDTTVNISAASGLSFYFKGDTCDVRIETGDILDFHFYFKRIPKAANWTLITLQKSDMAQDPTWGIVKPFNLAVATKVAWQTPNTGIEGNTGSLWVDDIHLTGFIVPTQARETPSPRQSRDKGFSVALDNAKSMTLRYDLPAAGAVDIGLYNLAGKLVKQLFIGTERPGHVTQSLSVPQIGSTHGTYLVQLKTPTGCFSDKLVLVK